MAPNWLRKLGSAALQREIDRARLDREGWKRQALGAEARERAAGDRAEQQRRLMDRQVDRIQYLEDLHELDAAELDRLREENARLEKALDLKHFIAEDAAFKRRMDGEADHLDG